MDHVYLSSKYDAEIYHLPYWNSSVIYNETIYPLENKDGSISDIPLMYHAEEIFSVRSYDLETLFTQGEDYVLKDGKISILPNGNSPTAKYSEYYFDEEKPGKCRPLKDGGFALYSEGGEFYRYQLCVSYKHSDTWKGPIPKKKGHLLPLLHKKLSNKEPIKAVMFGDSITWGANSSGRSNTKPFVPRWADMFPSEIERNYHCPVEVINTAVGGKTSTWGKDVIYESVVSHHPDLAVIGFGMNDGSNQIAPEVFDQNIRSMIDAIRKESPNSTIILLNCILQNKELVRYCDGFQEKYTSVFEKIEKDYKEVAFTDIMALHKHLLTLKKYADMTGNNINHINDFTARLYSQALFATIQK